MEWGPQHCDTQWWLLRLEAYDPVAFSPANTDGFLPPGKPVLLMGLMWLGLGCPIRSFMAGALW